MKFTLEIEVGDAVKSAVDVASLLNDLHHELREDGFTGTGVISTRPQYRASADGKSTELVRYEVGSWKLA